IASERERVLTGAEAIQPNAFGTMRRVRSRIFAGMPLQAKSANLRSLQLMDSTGLVPRPQPPTARFGLANPRNAPAARDHPRPAPASGFPSSCRLAGSNLPEAPFWTVSDAPISRNSYHSPQ